MLLVSERRTPLHWWSARELLYLVNSHHYVFLYIGVGVHLALVITLVVKGPLH